MYLINLLVRCGIIKKSPRDETEELPKRTPSEETDVTSKYSLLVLPTEILAMVSKQLLLPDRIRLAQTCSRLRSLANSSCERECKDLSEEARFHLLNDLVYTMPEKFVCRRCHAMHTWKKKDVPQSARREYRCGSRLNEGAFSTGLLEYYAFAQRHVHMALKLKRMYGPNHPDLQKLLEPGVVESISAWWPDPTFRSWTSTHTPGIRDGRLYLHIRYHFEISSHHLGKPITSLRYLPICPHLVRSRPYGSIEVAEPIDGRFMQALETCRAQFRANHLDQTSLDGYCPQCPTDYSITIEIRQLTINVWQDLGNGKSFADPSWLAVIYHRPEGEPADVDPMISRTPQSIRNKYLRLPSDWRGVEYDAACRQATFPLSRCD